MAEPYKSRTEFTPDGRVLRVLDLLRIMQRRRVSVVFIAGHLDVSTRTAYRYLVTIHLAGFPLMQEGQGSNKRFYIEKYI